MQSPMNDTIVCITGAAGALGSAVSRRAVKDGMRALLVDSEHARERLTKLEAELGAGRAAAAVGDITVDATWERALARSKDAFGALPTRAVLVAGGWKGGAPVHAERDDAAWRAMADANAGTVHRSLRALLPAMVAAKDGSVVVVGSRAAVQPWTSAGAAAYAASKAAVVALAQAVAAEVLESGVRVNAILPSTKDTPANRASMPKADPARWVATDSVAAVCAFLMSEASRDVSGAAIPVYGRS
jgi:NAD(P)-dependent dehydrogenase (short-subunit alcohol dehydrogenase family)